MNINYYRDDSCNEGYQASWQNCQFNNSTDLSSLTVKPLVTINRQPFIRQHHITYLTGKETCHAHHFAKLLATKLLASPYAADDHNCKVLWIDTVHGPHICAKIFQELKGYVSDQDSLHFVCLDILGSLRENFYALNRNIETLIKKLKPELVVIDDIDHLMPLSGINTAYEFCKIVRDVTNHSETAFLFIGYNHLGKKASTAGNVGKFLFLNASDIFALSTQGNVTTVRLVNSYDMSCTPLDTLYKFTFGTDNLPHEVNTLKSASQDNSNAHNDKEIATDVNNPLTLPTPPSSQQSPHLQQDQPGCDSVASPHQSSQPVYPCRDTVTAPTPPVSLFPCDDTL